MRIIPIGLLLKVFSFALYGNFLILLIIIVLLTSMECPACFLRYSTTQRRPTIIQCGHTICSSCLTTSSKCKICTQDIDQNKKDCLNYSLMEIIQKDVKEIDKYVKVCFVGSSMTGKTSLIKRLMGNKFFQETVTTIGYDFSFFDRKVDNLNVRYQLWDSAGQQKYRAISPIHFKNADIVVIVYDISQSDPQNRLMSWIEESLANSPEDAKIIITGNKFDLHVEEKVKPIDDRTLKQIQTSQFTHLKISCKTGYGVDVFWEALDNQLRNKLKQKKKNLMNFQRELEEIQKRKETITKIKKTSTNNGIGLKSKSHNSCC